jgi:hypothetical protein
VPSKEKVLLVALEPSRASGFGVGEAAFPGGTLLSVGSKVAMAEARPESKSESFMLLPTVARTA